MKLHKTIKIRALPGACQRTKNRIRENGPEFVVRSKAKTCAFDHGGQMWIRFESVACRASDGKGGKEAWQGWLPETEIEVINESR